MKAHTRVLSLNIAPTCGLESITSESRFFSSLKQQKQGMSSADKRSCLA